MPISTAAVLRVRTADASSSSCVDAARAQRLQGVDDHQAHVAPRTNGFGESLDARWHSLDHRRDITQAQRRGSHVGSRCLVERSPAQVVDPCTPFESEHALEDAIRRCFAGEEHRRHAAQRSAHRHGEGEGRLAATDVASQDDQVAAAHSAAEELIDTRKAEGDGVGRAGPIGPRVDAPYELRERRDVG